MKSVMRLGKFMSAILAVASMASVISCDRNITDAMVPDNDKTSSLMVNDVTANVSEATKSAVCLTKTREFGDDEFSISEYVGDIDDVFGALGMTRGSIVTTTAINKPGESFTVNGWAMVSPERGKPQTLTNHLPKLTASYTSSGTKHWPWAGGADPKWINETPLHIWSYYPIGKIDPVITIDDDGVHTANTASFTSYTTDNTDLLIAYNSESRQFETDAKGNHTYNSDGQITDEIIGSPSFDVKFHHALSAVEFELKTTTTGADVHSITLCYVNPSTKQIVTTTGIATTGDCVATGSGTGKGTVSFNWSNLSNRKPLHYEFGSGQSVAGGYTLTGAGVLFMIPQQVENITIIVEFSKNGSTYYNAKVSELEDVTWEAGKYYKYRLNIGEFHVPGELYTALTDVTIDGLKSDKGSTGFLRPESGGLPTKGVTKVGLVINYWQLGSKDGQTVYVNGVKDGVDQIPALPATPPTKSEFTFDFAPVSESPLPNTNNGIYSVGDNVEETYYSYYSFSPPTGDQKSRLGTPKTGPFYYVFDCTGAEKFQVIFKPSAEDNSGGFFADVRCMLAIEIAPDPDLPINFPLAVWP